MLKSTGSLPIAAAPVGPGRSGLSVLLIDDARDQHALIRGILKRFGPEHELDWEPDFESGRRTMGERRHDVYLVDYQLGRDRGLDLIREARADGHDAAMILLTGREDEAVFQEALDAGACDYLMKDQVGALLIERSIRHSLERTRTRNELARERQRLDGLLGSLRDIVWSCSCDDAGLLFINRAAEASFGRPTEDLLAAPQLWRRHVVQDDQSRFDAFLSEVMSEGEAECELGIQSNGGGRRLLALRASLADAEDSANRRIDGVATDVTERRAAEEVLSKRAAEDAALAADIQKRLLFGRCPAPRPGLSLGVLTRPSQAVDGDFYDFVPYDEQVLDFIVGDVMGKGFHAALLGAATRRQLLVSLNGLLVESGGQAPDIAAIVSSSGEALSPELIELERFTTLFYGRLDRKRCILEYLDCGHSLAFHYRVETQLCSPLRGEHLPLGVVAEEDYEALRCLLAPGDLIVVCSDGLTEARSPDGELFGEERLRELIISRAQLGPEALLQNLESELLAFAGREDLDDDVTCIALGLDPLEHERIVSEGSLSIAASLQQLARARGLLREELADCPHLDFDGFALAVNEALANVIEHGLEEASDAYVMIIVRRWPDRVVVEIHHDGKAYQPKDEAPLDLSRDRHFGRYIIGRLVDEIRYDDAADGARCVSLIKRLEGKED